MRITGGWTTFKSIWMLGLCLFFVVFYFDQIDTLGWILGGLLVLMFLVDVAFHIRRDE